MKGLRIPFVGHQPIYIYTYKYIYVYILNHAIISCYLFLYPFHFFYCHLLFLSFLLHFYFYFSGGAGIANDAMTCTWKITCSIQFSAVVSVPCYCFLSFSPLLFFAFFLSVCTSVLLHFCLIIFGLYSISHPRSSQVLKTGGHLRNRLTVNQKTWI